MAGTFGSFDNAIWGDEAPDIKSKLVVTDPAVFNRTGGMLKDWSADRSDWKGIYDRFKQDWEAGQPGYESNANQEKGFLDKFYNGNFAGYLSNLRNREADARRAAGDRALQYAQGSADRASILRGEPTGTSSATRAMGARMAKDIETEIGLADVNRERGDFDYLNRSQAGYMGVRNGIVDAVAKRKLYPHQLNDAELMHAIQALGGIQGVRSGASQPVLWRERPLHELVAAGADSFNDTLGNMMSAYEGGGYTPSANSTNSASGYTGQQSGGQGVKYQDEMMNGPRGYSDPYDRGNSYENSGPPGDSGPGPGYGGDGSPGAGGGGEPFDISGGGGGGFQDYGQLAY